jgi:hypothetical protein
VRLKLPEFFIHTPTVGETRFTGKYSGRIAKAFPENNPPGMIQKSTDPAHTGQLGRYLEAVYKKTLSLRQELNKNPRNSGPYLTQTLSTPKIEVSP